MRLMGGNTYSKMIGGNTTSSCCSRSSVTYADRRTIRTMSSGDKQRAILAPESTRVALIILVSLMASASTAQLDGSTPRRTLTGIVVDAAGKPVAGVRYWVNNFYTDQGGELHYTGILREAYTDGKGHFSCEYGGQGRPEVAISVAFFHPKYAPTWAVKKRYDESPVTVQLDPGVELNGIAAVNGSRAEGHLYQWPLHLRLECWSGNLGGTPVRIEVQTNSEGRFTCRIPTEYATCHYRLYFAGHELTLKLQSEKPPPFIELRSMVEMDLKPVESQEANK